MLDKTTKALLPSIIRNTMQALSDLTNAPDEMTLPVCLSVANYAVQALYNVNPIKWDACAVSEYFVALTPSGGMKTSVSDAVLKGIRKYEREQERIVEQDQTDYLVACKKYKSQIDDEAKNPTCIKILKPVKPRGCRYRVEKATTNGLINTLNGVPFAGLFSSDAGEFFSSHSFQDSTKSIEMISTLSKAWSGEDLDRVTGIEDNNVRLHNRRFNMLVMLQQELAGFLNNSAYKDQGFTNRMLITQCELFEKPMGDFSRAGILREETISKLLVPFNDRVYDLLDTVQDRQIQARIAPMMLPGMTVLEKMQAKVKAEDAMKAAPNELILQALNFADDGARQVAQDFYNRMRLASMDIQYIEYSNFMSRAYEHFCRLAATLAAFELREEIDLGTAQAAVGLMDYFIDQRMNLNVDGILKSNPLVECGEKVVRWLEKFGGEATKSDLVQRGPAAYRKMIAEDRVRVICDLEARELVKIVEVEGTGLKSKHVIRLIATKVD